MLAYLVLLVNLVLCTFSALKVEEVDACIFSYDDIPVPEDAILFHDPRRELKCRATSFDQTRPTHLFDPSGLRMWTREEDTMVNAIDQHVKKLYREEVCSI